MSTCSMNQGESFYYVWSEYVVKAKPSELATLLDNPRVRAAESKTRCNVEFTRRVLNKRQKFSEWARYSIVRITGPDDQSIGQCNRLLEQVIPAYRFRKEYPRRAPITLYLKDVEAEGDLRSRLGNIIGTKKKRGLSESDNGDIYKHARKGSRPTERRSISVKSSRNVSSPCTVPDSSAFDISEHLHSNYEASFPAVPQPTIILSKSTSHTKSGILPTSQSEDQTRGSCNADETCGTRGVESKHAPSEATGSASSSAYAYFDRFECRVSCRLSVPIVPNQVAIHEHQASPQSDATSVHAAPVNNQHVLLDCLTSPTVSSPTVNATGSIIELQKPASIDHQQTVNTGGHYLEHSSSREAPLNIALSHKFSEQSNIDSTEAAIAVKAVLSTQMSFDSVTHLNPSPRPNEPNSAAAAATDSAAIDNRELPHFMPSYMNDATLKLAAEHSHSSITAEIIEPFKKNQTSPTVECHSNFASQPDGSVFIHFHVGLRFYIPSEVIQSTESAPDLHGIQMARALWTKEFAFNVSDARAHSTVICVRVSISCQSMPLKTCTLSFDANDLPEARCSPGNAQVKSLVDSTSFVNLSSVPSFETTRPINIIKSGTQSTADSKPRVISPDPQGSLPCALGVSESPKSHHLVSTVPSDLTNPGVNLVVTENRLCDTGLNFKTHTGMNLSIDPNESDELTRLTEPEVVLQDRPSHMARAHCASARTSSHPFAWTSPAKAKPVAGQTSPVSLTTTVSTNVEVRVNRETRQIDLSLEVSGSPLPHIGSDITLPMRCTPFSSDWSIRLEQNATFGPIGFISSPPNSRTSPGCVTTDVC